MTNEAQSRNRLGWLAWLPGAILVFVCLPTSPALAQFSSGSTGSLGAFAPSSNTTVTLPADGILNYTTVNIPAGVTVTFTPNAANTPVTLLATGDVTIAGILSLNGTNAAPASVPGSAPTPGSLGGPGGFAGGQGGLKGGVNNGGSAGQGAGGGSGGYPPSVSTEDGFYGAASNFVGLIPLFGGSGGGGGSGDNGSNGSTVWGAAGAGGGGAIVIASTTQITIASTGVIRANGGAADYSYTLSCNWFTGGAGSGGAIRLVAPQVTNQGTVQALGGNPGCTPVTSVGGPGRIRIECTTCTTGTPNPSPSTLNTLGPVAPASTPPLTNQPTVTITSVGGIAAPGTPGGTYSTPDVSLPQGTSTPVTAVLTATNTPVGTTFTVRVVTEGGPDVLFTSTASVGTFASSTATAKINLLSGRTSLLYAYTNYTQVQSPAPPTTPTNLTATPISTSQINLSWSASIGDLAVTGYRVERCQGVSCTNFTEIAQLTGTSYSNTGLSAGTSYSYRVQARDTAGNASTYSNIAAATTVGDTPPTAPSNLTATPISSSQIDLAWTASTDDFGVSRYRVERCTGAGCSNFAEIAQPTGTTYSNTGLTGGTTYVYRVRAEDTVGQFSTYSNTANATTTTSDLAGHWKFDEGTGTTAADSSGNANHGTLLNGPTWVSGQSGQAVQFDGSNDYVKVDTTTALNLSSAITIAAWVKPDALSQFYSNVVVKGLPGQRGYALNFQWDKVNFVKIGVEEQPSSVAFSTGIWQHVAVTWDVGTGQVKIYKNGVLMQTQSRTAAINAPTNDDDLTIGSWTDPGTTLFDGTIDDVRIYNRVLTAAEISQIVDGVTGRVAQWTFDDGSGTTATDSSTNANHGTLTNGPTWVTGQSGQAVSLDGSNDLVAVATTTGLNLSNTLTLTAWVKPTALTNPYSSVVLKGVAGQRGYGMNFVGDKLNFVSVGMAETTSTVAFATGKWQHAAITWDAATGQAKFYKDGTLVQTMTPSGAPTAPLDADDVTIGSWLDQAGSFFNGSLDDVRIYNRVLTATEIAQVVDVSTGRVAQWKFDEGTGTTAGDSSSNANSGTLANGPTWVTGQSGQAVSLDGTNDLIAVDTTAGLNLNNTLTITAWVKPTALTGYRSVVFKGVAGQRGYGMNFVGDKLNFVKLGISEATSTVAFTTGTWQHAAITLDAFSGQVKFYKNGTLVETISATGAANAALDSDDVTIGSWLDQAQSFFAGTIDDLRIYNRVLSASEIAEIGTP